MFRANRTLLSCNPLEGLIRSHMCPNNLTLYNLTECTFGFLLGRGGKFGGFSLHFLVYVSTFCLVCVQNGIIDL